MNYKYGSAMGDHGTMALPCIATDDDGNFHILPRMTVALPWVTIGDHGIAITRDRTTMEPSHGWCAADLRIF